MTRSAMARLSNAAGKPQRVPTSDNVPTNYTGSFGGQPGKPSDNQCDYPATAIRGREYDRIIMHAAPMRDQPDAANPVEQ
jgi:hypothetical protein